jgi:hypothetical protein
MTSLESVIPFDLDRRFFDPAEIEILSAAFGKAWAFVEFDPKLGVLEASKRQSELARYLMALLKLGEMNPILLANSAIRLLHERHVQERLVPRGSPVVGHRERLVGASTVT